MPVGTTHNSFVDHTDPTLLNPSFSPCSDCTKSAQLRGTTVWGSSDASRGTISFAGFAFVLRWLLRPSYRFSRLGLQPTAVRQSCGGGVWSADQTSTETYVNPVSRGKRCLSEFAGPNEFPALDALKINAAFIVVYYYALYICLTHKLCRARRELLWMPSSDVTTRCNHNISGSPTLQPEGIFNPH